MNNIIFSNLTRKQILEAYKNKEYKKTILALRNIFTTRNSFLKFLNENVVNLVDAELRKFREVLYIWTVIEEFKKILNGKLDVITVAYMQEYEKDYVKEYFSDDEIKKIKKESNKYFIKQKNRLLLKNYEDGNFEYVMTSLKCDYKDYFDYEASIDVNNGMAYERSEIAPLRELSQIFNHTDFNKTSNNILNYQYAMLKNLISIYKHMKIEYTERYLLRQKKIGVNIEECITNQDLLKLFNTEERTILSRIYKENVKNGLKVNKGIGLYNKDEYTRNIHTIMNILEIPGTITEKYNVMKFKSAYTIHYAGVKYAVENNYDRYNFYGITGDFNENNPLYGLFLFKKSFGGHVVELLGEYDLIISKFWYHTYNIMFNTYHNLKKLKLKLKK